MSRLLQDTGFLADKARFTGRPERLSKHEYRGTLRFDNLSPKRPDALEIAQLPWPHQSLHPSLAATSPRHYKPPEQLSTAKRKDSR